MLYFSLCHCCSFVVFTSVNNCIPHSLLQICFHSLGVLAWENMGNARRGGTPIPHISVLILNQSWYVSQKQNKTSTLLFQVLRTEWDPIAHLLLVTETRDAQAALTLPSLVTTMCLQDSCPQFISGTDNTSLRADFCPSELLSSDHKLHKLVKDQKGKEKVFQKNAQMLFPPSLSHLLAQLRDQLTASSCLPGLRAC